MSKRSQKQLAKELQQAGATKAEVKDLLPLAASLSQLKVDSPIRRRGWQGKSLKFAAIASLGFAIGIFLIISAEAALPTSPLYRVQKASDAVAVDLYSPYRANVMMKRAQQVRILVAKQASQQTVLATLADYNKLATAYKINSHDDYAALEYCKLNLQQAAQNTRGAELQAITSSLQSLQKI